MSMTPFVITPEYRSWLSMRQRCRNPKDPHYDSYGGRGIVICDRWNSFQNFLADMGPRPQGTSIDRSNTDGNYEPGNCSWADRVTQNRNRRSVKRYCLEGELLTLPEIAEKTGFPRHQIYDRVRMGVPLDKALSDLRNR